MKNYSFVFFLITISTIIAGCNPSQPFRSTLTVTPMNTSTLTLTPTLTLTSTNTPTVTATPIHPLNIIVLHDANQEIPWRWFSYVPSGLDKTKPVFILVTGLHGFMGTYDDATSQTKMMIQERLGWPNINNFILLAPVIPRIDNPNQDEIYSVAFDLTSFRTPDEFARRADLKVNSIIDYFSNLLSADGFTANGKVLIEGFSAGAMFAQRYALLHPERVLAIAAGQCGGNFTLPITSFNGIPLNWPVGINDLESLSQIKFDETAYNQVFQFIFIGDQDFKIGNTILFPNEWGVTNMWQSISQRDFLRQTFGTEDPIRMNNEIEYLRDNGFNNITIKIYPGIGHQETDEMMDDKMTFLMSVIDPSYVHLPTPTSSVAVVIDGYGNDWAGFASVSDPSGDSPNPNLDITAYYYTQDDNYLDIMLQTGAPITRDTATLDIGLSLQSPDGKINNFEFNINSDGSAWAAVNPDSPYRALGVLVAWNDVVEIQIPKSVFGDSVFSRINFISLFTNLDGAWTAVDSIP